MVRYPRFLLQSFIKDNLKIILRKKKGSPIVEKCYKTGHTAPKPVLARNKGIKEDEVTFIFLSSRVKFFLIFPF
jgi:hypothetical protein